ncbi:TPA: hypothetical protein MAF81_003649 [Klebsiella variicola subsp. variicola]|nr:hypothetical protein [Klebsiella variicola subsp. variicola]
MNHITNHATLGLKAINNNIPAYHYPVSYQAGNRPTALPSDEGCAVFL